MNVDVIVLITIVCGIGGLTISYVVSCRNKAKDDKAEGASVATITSDMGYVKSGIEGINKKLEVQDERHLVVVERLCTVETSARSAHKRLDDILEKGNHHE